MRGLSWRSASIWVCTRTCTSVPLRWRFPGVTLDLEDVQKGTLFSLGNSLILTATVILSVDLLNWGFVWCFLQLVVGWFCAPSLSEFQCTNSPVPGLRCYQFTSNSLQETENLLHTWEHFFSFLNFCNLAAAGFCAITALWSAFYVVNSHTYTRGGFRGCPHSMACSPAVRRPLGDTEFMCCLLEHLADMVSWALTSTLGFLCGPVFLGHWWPQTATSNSPALEPWKYEVPVPRLLSTATRCWPHHSLVQANHISDPRLNSGPKYRPLCD